MFSWGREFDTMIWVVRLFRLVAHERFYLGYFAYVMGACWDFGQAGSRCAWQAPVLGIKICGSVFREFFFLFDHARRCFDIAGSQVLFWSSAPMVRSRSFGLWFQG